jgi:hypothetical protein
MNAAHAGFAAFGAVLTSIWLITLTAMRKRTPSADIHPQPPTRELRPEPPAVAAMLIHKGLAGTEPVAGTLIDLAARRVVGLAQIGQQLTVRLSRDRDGVSLTPYEQRVLGHVQALAVNGALPAQALGDVEDGPHLGSQGFGSEVTAEARARGLATKRWESGAMAWMILFAAWAGASLGLGLANPPGVADDVVGLVVGAVNGALIGALIFSIVRGSDRLTPDGAVAAVQALPIGRDTDRQTALIPDGGDEWRSVEVTYPHGSGYGSSPASLVFKRLFVAVQFGFWAFVLIYFVPRILSGSGSTLAVAARGASPLIGVVGVLLGGSGIYERVSERDLIRASVTRRYRYVYRVQVLTRHASLGS